MWKNKIQTIKKIGRPICRHLPKHNTDTAEKRRVCVYIYIYTYCARKGKGKGRGKIHRRTGHKRPDMEPR